MEAFVIIAATIIGIVMTFVADPNNKRSKK